MFRVWVLVNLLVTRGSALRRIVNVCNAEKHSDLFVAKLAGECNLVGTRLVLYRPYALALESLQECWFRGWVAVLAFIRQLRFQSGYELSVA